MRLLPTFKYPKPRRAQVKEVLHGIEVDDVYRWMENPDADETKAFVKAQNSISKPFIINECVSRQEMKNALSAVYNYERFTAPRKVGAYYYYNHNSGLQNQSVIYRKKELSDESAEVFLDPNVFSEDGTVAIAGAYPSKAGNYYAYAISKSGSDWRTIYIRRTSDKQDLPDRIERVRYSNMAWAHDEKGFFYGQYPDWKGHDVSGTDAKAAENQKIYYHRLGGNQSEDILVAEFPDHPRWRTRVDVSDCGTKLILETYADLVSNMVYVVDISSELKPLPPLKTIRGTFTSKLSYITNDGDTYYWRTNIDRPNYAVIKLNINEPEKWEEVIPEDPKRALVSVDVRGRNKFIASYIEDVATVIEIFNMKGERLQKLPFDIGSITLVSGERHLSEVFFQLVSFANPTIVYRCELDRTPLAQLVEYKRVELKSWTTEDLKYKQVFFNSADNTKIPMYIMHRANQTPSRSNPALMYVYGGFGTSLTPTFSLFNLMLVYTLGFFVSIANVRGGGEYGERWHDAGRLRYKQNTLDDVHAAARFLVENNYTSAANLTLTGRSNGGFVTLASVNQRPELFGAAIAGVPVADLLRFHKFTIGHAWVSDYGSPDNATEFAFIHRISPLHNIPQSLENYPALLITTADHDDRVVPSHSLKFIAELQYRAQSQSNFHMNSTIRSSVESKENREQTGKPNDDALRPFLSLIDTKAGHGAGKPIHKRIDDIVDQMCFLMNSLNLSYDGSKFKDAIKKASTVKTSFIE